MNSEHVESIIMYAEYYGKEKNIKTAKLVDLNDEYMVIEINGNKRINVNFIKKVTIDEIKYLLVEMSKEAKNYLNKQSFKYEKRDITNQKWL